MDNEVWITICKLSEDLSFTNTSVTGWTMSQFNSRKRIQSC
ncbi:hypothetical protein Leryth_009427 [Lithospermum erythrorhizon]|nr:hypothetical protein Leryth_009427 [Lithospermum erythrorhizon]